MRHLALPEMGAAGQAHLKASRVLLVGAGGLGSPIALYLAAAGVGTIGVVDSDVVEVHNLQRQVLHRTDRVGQPKAASAAQALEALNPLVAIRPTIARVTDENVDALLAGYQVVIDGTDNFATRYVLNDACARAGVPLVFGSIYRFEGQASVFDARRGPCYRCLFPEPPPADAPPTTATAGVLGVMPGLVGLVQATEVLKLLLGLGEPLIGRLLLIDALTMTFRDVRVLRSPDCPVCASSTRPALDPGEKSAVRTR